MGRLKNVIWEELPRAQLYTPEPYYGCPKCESHEYGARDPWADHLIYECHECRALFRGVPGVHHAKEKES